MTAFARAFSASISSLLMRASNCAASNVAFAILPELSSSSDSHNVLSPDGETVASDPFDALSGAAGGVNRA